MQVYSVIENGEAIFYFIEDETKNVSKGVLTATNDIFKGFCFTPLNVIQLQADEVIIDKTIFNKQCPSNSMLNFNGTKSYFGALGFKDVYSILESLQSEGKGTLKTTKKHMVLKIVLAKLLDLRNVLWINEDFTSLNMPIIINHEDIVESVDKLLIEKFGTDWTDGLNYPNMVSFNDGSRLSLYMALYLTSIGLDVYDYICQDLNTEIYYVKDMPLNQFVKENEKIAKYLKPETYGIDVISKIDSVYIDSSFSHNSYNGFELDDNTMINLVKKVISDYYTPVFKNSMLKQVFKLLEIPREICNRKEAKEIIRELFLTLGYSENLIDKGSKKKYTADKLKTKEDILKLMVKAVNTYGEWWQDLGLLPWSIIDNVEFLKWLELNKPKSYENACLVATKNGENLKNLDLDIIIAYATNGKAYMVPDKKKGLKNIDKTKIISVASEYKSRDEEKRQMELISEYSLITNDVIDYLLDVFNEIFG